MFIVQSAIFVLIEPSLSSRTRYGGRARQHRGLAGLRCHGRYAFQNDKEFFHLHIHVVPRWSTDDFKLPDPMIEALSLDERQHQALALQRALT